jgi:hypothetical protein
MHRPPSDARRPRVLVRYIRAPSPAPESFPGGRSRLYRWLALKLLETEDCDFGWPESKCITAEQMLHPRIEDIENVIQFKDNSNDKTNLEIIDIANNHYHPLNDILLYQIATVLRHRIGVASRRTVVILLPLLPAESSVFWSSMPSTGIGPGDAISTFVIANDGRSWPSGHLAPDDCAEYRSIAASQAPDLVEMLRARTVTQVGHYDLGATDRPRCAMEFFDTEAAELEMGELAIRWAKENHLIGPRFTLISYGRRGAAARFHRAMSGAATALNCGFQSVTASDAMPSSEDIRGTAVLVFNVVDSGLAFRRVVNNLRANGVRVASKALTVLKTEPKVYFGRRYPELTSLCDGFERKVYSRKECPQCRLGLAYTPRSSDRYLPVRAIDIWRILLACRWNHETFGPVGRPFMRYAPDMADVFERYGDWFAYKVGELLRSLGMERDLVFICPDEPHVERLIRKLGIIMQNRQVAVLIPRSVLDNFDLDRDLDNREGNDWYTQLSYLRNRKANIVLIDEFSRSFSTANDIIRLLEHGQLGLRHSAYIPVLDLAPESVRRPPLTYPLYRLPVLGFAMSTGPE